jgi:hypothetical protein
MQLHDEIVSTILIVFLDLFIRKKTNSFLLSLGIFSIALLESISSSSCLFSNKLLFVNTKVVKIIRIKPIAINEKETIKVSYFLNIFHDYAMYKFSNPQFRC